MAVEIADTITSKYIPDLSPGISIEGLLGYLPHY